MAPGETNFDPNAVFAKVSLPVGSVIGHYEVLRFLGDGGMATVYLARDQQLGRRVALKLLNKSDENLAVLAEARMLAQFNHPNIITVYGVGTHDGEPYIAMEFIEGDTMRLRCDSETLSLRETQRLALAIAQGLEEAHRRNIVHGDLKPENVMIGRDGRARILDFGLAKSLDSKNVHRDVGTGNGPVEKATGATNDVKTSPDLDAETKHTKKISYPDNPIPAEEQTLQERTDIKGTPAYMAPEQWRGIDRTPAVDIWAFGVILFELLTGERPYDVGNIMDIRMLSSADPLPSVMPRRELPEALASLVDRCLAKSPFKRPSASEAVRALLGLIHGDGHAINEVESPFRGLSAFTEEHANFFFGRDDDIGLFIERLRTEVVLPVVGASGVGKSSFIQAGVIPRLREKGEWRIIRMRPGADPFRTLATRFWRTGSGTQSGPITEPDEGAAREVEDLAQQLYQNPKLLALWLQRQAKTEHGKVLLLVDQLEEVCTLVAEPETRKRFLSAICNAADDPADPVRVVFTARDDFLSRLAESNDARMALQRVAVLRAPGQEALREILERPLQAVGYRYDDPTLVDEVVSAVANEASALPLVQFMGSMLWERRDSQERTLLRSAYTTIGGVQGALATHADDVLASMGETQTRLVRAVMLRLITPEGTRRVTSRGAIVEALGAAADDVLLRLSQARLLAVRDVFGETHYELSHESLVKTWDRLAVWLEEGREEIIFLNELEQASALWEKRGRRRNEVWTGPALIEAIRNIDRYRSKLTESSSLFITASKAAERTKQRIKRIVVAGAAVTLVAIAVISIITSISFADKKRIAEEQRAQAQAEGARSSFLRGDFVAAWAQLRSSIEIADSSLVRALWAQMTSQPVTWRKVMPSMLYDVAVSPDGETLAVGALDHSIYLVNRHTAESRSLRDASDQVMGLTYSPDGTRLAACDMGGSVYSWDLSNDQVIRASVHKGACWKLSYSRDGRSLATASFDGSVAVLDAATLTERARIDGLGPVLRSAFSPDGSVVIVGTKSGVLREHDASTGTLRNEILTGEKSPVTMLVVQGKQDYWVGFESGRLVHVLDGKVQHSVTAHDSAVTGSVRVGDDLVTSSYDAVLKRWTPQLAEVRSWRLHDSGIVGLTLLQDNKVASAGHGDRSLVVWDPAVADTAAIGRGHQGPVQSVKVNPQGSAVYSSGDDGTVREWQIATGAQSRVFAQSKDSVAVLAVSPDGERIASGSFDKLVRVQALKTGKITVFSGHENAIYGVWFIAGGRELLSVAMDATIRHWDVSTGRLLRTGSLPFGAIGGSMGSQRLVLSSLDGGTMLVDPVTFSTKVVAATGFGVAQSPVDSRFAVAGNDGKVRLYANDSLASTINVSAVGGRFGAWSNETNILGFGFVDGAYLWPADKPELKQRLSGHAGEVSNVAFSPDGKTAFTAGDDGTVRSFDSVSGAARWRLIGVSRSLGMMASHRGTTNFAGKPVVIPSSATAALMDARAFDERNDQLCVWQRDGFVRLSIFSTGADVAKSSQAYANVEQLTVAASGCWFRVPGAAHWLGKNGPQVVSEVSRLGQDDAGEVILLGKGKIGRVNKESTVVWQEVNTSPSVVGVVGQRLLLGYPNGSLETFADGSRVSLNLQQQPSGGVASIRPGPLDTMVIGYTDGSVGVWSSSTGARLLYAKVHGPAATIVDDGAQQIIISDLGDTATLDFSGFRLSWCALTNAVRQTTLLAWDQGRPVLTKRSQDPTCATP